MQNFPWLTVLIALPAVGAIVLWLVPGAVRAAARQIAVAWSVIVFAGAVAATCAYQSGTGAVRLTQSVNWISQFGITYSVGVSGVGIVMILLSTLLVPLVLLAAWKEQDTSARSAHYAALVLILESFMVAVFAARDLVLFYILFEAMLIPVYFLVGSFGGEGRKKAALKFLLYSLAGGLVMLAGVIGLWSYAGSDPGSMRIDNLTGLHLGTVPERLIFLAFFVAFAIKAPMWPVHTWLPDTAQAAKPGTSVLLVGVLDKVGTFGMLTLCLPLFPNASRWAAPVIIVLAIVSIIWGGLMALAQKDILRFIAYTSVSHFGFIVLGIFAFTQTSELGSTFYMVNHGLSTGALFFLAGYLIRRRGTQNMAEMGPGLQRNFPLLAGTFLVTGLAVIALPGLSTFVSELQVIVGAFQTHHVAAVIAAAGVILAALYILMTYQRVFTGPKRMDLTGEGAKDLGGRELTVVGVLIAIMLVLGFYPSPAVNILNDSAQTAVTQSGSTQATHQGVVTGPTSGEQKGGQQ
ncbi:MAG: NADH-quinone oxidoreductase subunit M [Bifidobacteriaceae bacterium]|jgi:NADH-quinone oxidoreductase subunit M|nr:NADH-quinone oxidoreductase subunit M [Bifidobacteriaceae bacterium]